MICGKIYMDFTVSPSFLGGNGYQGTLTSFLQFLLLVGSVKVIP